MNNDLSSYFEDPEFKEILAKYEGMVESHTPTYFDAEDLTDIAEYYASINEEAKADAAIDLALQLHPANTDALVFKARSQAIKGNLDEAYRIAALIEDTSDREVKFLKGDLLIEERRLEEADQIYQELAATEGESQEVLLDIANTYLDANQKEYTLKWLERIREKGFDETNSQAFRDTWCDYCMTFGEPEKAIHALQLTLDEFPYSTHHWTWLAKCHLTNLDLEKASEAIDFALAIDDKNMEALEIKGFFLLQNGYNKEAEKLFRELLPKAKDKDKNRIYTLLSKSYFEQYMFQQALDTCLDWLKMVELTDYERSEIYVYISMCYYNMGNSQEGMSYINASLDINPFNLSAIIQKAILHLQLCEDQEATNLFQKALSLAPEDEQCDIAYQIADAYSELQLFADTIAWCQRIIEQYPQEQEEALYQIAYSYYMLGNNFECIQYLRKAWELGNNQFNEEFKKDKRFADMFSELQVLLDQFFN